MGAIENRRRIKDLRIRIKMLERGIIKQPIDLCDYSDQEDW